MKINIETKLIILVFWTVIVATASSKLAAKLGLSTYGASILASSAIAITLLSAFLVEDLYREHR